MESPAPKNSCGFGMFIGACFGLILLGALASALIGILRPAWKLSAENSRKEELAIEEAWHELSLAAANLGGFKAATEMGSGQLSGAVTNIAGRGAFYNDYRVLLLRDGRNYVVYYHLGSALTGVDDEGRRHSRDALRRKGAPDDAPLGQPFFAP